MRLLRNVRARELALLLVLLGVAIEAAAEEPLMAAHIGRAMQATGLVRVERIFQSDQFTTYGSAFCVHPDGYYLTSAHVVSIRIPVRLGGTLNDLSTRVLSMQLVIGGGTAGEEVATIRVASADTELDLALLKASRPCRAVLAVERQSPPEVTDEVWVVGFPFGAMISLDDSGADAEERNPEASVNAGRVSSLRRDPSGALKAIQMDAPVNPGNSGGPLLNASGQVVGLVFSKVLGGESVGFAVPPEVLGGFLDSRRVSVNFSPPAISPSLERLVVAVEPMLASLEGLVGEATLEAEGLASVSAPFESTPSGMRAELVLDGLAAGSTSTSRFLATVVLRDRSGGEVVRRRLRLKSTLHEGALASAGEAEQQLANRPFMANTNQLRDQGRLGKGSGKTLAEVAAELELNRGDGGEVIVDNATVDRFGDHSTPEICSAVPEEELCAALQRYDRLVRELCSLRERARRDHQEALQMALKRRRPIPASSGRESEIAYLQREVDQLRRWVQGAGLVRCHGGQWVKSPPPPDCVVDHSSPNLCPEGW